MTAAQATATRTLLSARGVRLRRGGRDLFDGVDLDLAPGEVVALEAETGQGATSLLKVCGGLLPPDAGDVTLEGADLYAAPYARRRAAKRRVGFVFQEMAMLQNQTLFQNVALPLLYHGRLGRHEIAARVEEILEACELREVAGRLPAELSKHQAHAAALARAFVCEPALLILDDYFARLTRKHRRKGWLDIRERLGEDAAVLIATTDIERLPVQPDRAFRLRDGALAGIDATRARTPEGDAP